ncbi:MAG: hypothetical protein JSS76_08445 [Bacteroidetes bacterium]|nr:hypothetical protein [Bacteroidota bacterium]
MGYNTLTKPLNLMPGLSKFLFCEKSAFSTIAPAIPGSQIIGADHTFPSGEGWKTAYIIVDEHTGKAATAGNKGSQTLKNEFSVFLPGIDDATLSFVKKALNDEFITLHKDADCDNPLWLQLGDECKGATMTCDLEIGTTAPDGRKGYILKFTWPGIMYIYTGQITYQPVMSLLLTYNP